MQVGQAIVVRTPDRREYRGTLLELRSQDDRQVAVVRLDTGWVTTYPLRMVSADSRADHDLHGSPPPE